MKCKFWGDKGGERSISIITNVADSDKKLLEEDGRFCICFQFFHNEKKTKKQSVTLLKNMHFPLP